MIRVTPLTSTVRFYDSEQPGPWDAYVAICTLVWESARAVWIVGLHGKVTRAHLRALARDLCAAGVDVVKAHRDPAKRLPWGRAVGDHVEIEVAEIVTPRPQRRSAEALNHEVTCPLSP